MKFTHWWLGLPGLLYDLGKNAGSRKNQNNSNTKSTETTKNEENTDSSTAKNINTYNYYTNESENGNTLFGSQKKTKRTLFGGE